MIIKEVDMYDWVGRYQEQAEEYAESQEEIVEEIEANYDSWHDVPDALEESWERLEEQRIDAQGKADRIGQAIEDWGGSIFRLSEMTAGNLAQIQDATGMQVDSAGEISQGRGGVGAAMVEAVRLGVEKAPPEAPDVTEYPWQVVEALFEAIEAINTTGDIEMGNSSLRETANL